MRIARPAVLTVVSTSLCLWMGAPGPAWAQDDPIPYSDQAAQRQEDPANKPGASDLTPTPRNDDLDNRERAKLLGRTDDSAVGLSVELLGGLMLLESSRGNGFAPQFGWGAQLTWDYGRLISDTVLHDAFFVDLSYRNARYQAGTDLVYVTSQYHYFTVAPAYEIPFGEGSAYGAYAQVGAGVALESSSLHSGTAITPVGGLRPVFQYGLGLRGRPLVSDDGRLRLVFRLELTRFRRAYMDDTYLGATFGIAY